MKPSTILNCIVCSMLLLLMSCKNDQAVMEQEAPAATAAVTEETPSQVGNTAPVSSSNGDFNYLTSCDSLLTEQFRLSNADGDSTLVLAKLVCAKNKSYETLIRTREGGNVSGTAPSVLAEAIKQPKQFLCYSFLIPKLNRPEGVIENMYPSNITVLRYDNNRWVRLGVEQVKDQSELNGLQWKILNDRMPKYQ